MEISSGDASASQNISFGTSIHHKNEDHGCGERGRVIKLICCFFGLAFALVIARVLSCHHKCYCSNRYSVIISIGLIIAHFRLSILLIIIEENKMENVETFQYYDTQVLTLRYLDPGLAPTLLILSSQLIQNAQS